MEPLRNDLSVIDPSTCAHCYNDVDTAGNISCHKCGTRGALVLAEHWYPDGHS